MSFVPVAEGRLAVLTHHTRCTGGKKGVDVAGIFQLARRMGVAAQAIVVGAAVELRLRKLLVLQIQRAHRVFPAETKQNPSFDRHHLNAHTTANGLKCRILPPISSGHGETDMVFSSPIFLFLFLPVVLTFYWVLPGVRARNYWLLITSLVFYAWGEVIFILLLLGSTLVNYFLGLWVERHDDPEKRKLAVGVAVAMPV